MGEDEAGSSCRASVVAPQGCARRPLATLRERKATANTGKLETMDISRFDELLAAARGQAERQRLLLVFAGASLPDGATAEQQARFEAGESGELAPLMCVDKDPGVLADFATLVEEASTLGPQWALVFAAALSGAGGRPPTDGQVDAALQHMVEAVRAGTLSGLIPFNRQGEAVQLD